MAKLVQALTQDQGITIADRLGETLDRVLTHLGEILPEGRTTALDHRTQAAHEVRLLRDRANHLLLRNRVAHRVLLVAAETVHLDLHASDKRLTNFKTRNYES